MEVFKLQIFDFENRMKIMYNKKRELYYKCIYFILLNAFCLPLLSSGISKELYLIPYKFIGIVFMLFFYFLVLIFLIYKYQKLKDITIQFKNELIFINNTMYHVSNLDYIKINRFTTDFGGENFQIILHLKNQKIIIKKIFEENVKNKILYFLLENLNNCKVIERHYLFQFPWHY
jgi:hypothetical protein